MILDKCRKVRVKFPPLIIGLLALSSPFCAFAFSAQLSPAQMSNIQRTASAEYRFNGVRAENPAQDWRLNFSPDGIEITDVRTQAKNVLKLKMLGAGNKKALQALEPVKPEFKGNRASYRRNLVEEWYVNGPLGLEQGFNVPKKLGDDLVLELGTNWLPKATAEGVQLSYGVRQWYFGALQAVDAEGKKLPSAMSVQAGKIRLEVDTREAQFPVAIDPILTRKATLMASDQTPFLGFGRSVAISGDGSTALVGSDNNAAYFYKRSATGWTQVQKIVKPATLHCNSNGSWFGWSVALSKDGSTAMVGTSGIFVFYSGFIPIHLFYSCKELPVYRKQGNVWVLEKLLTTPSVTPEAMFSSSVSLSQDGNRAMVGAQSTQCASIADKCGAVYLFERGATGWTNPRRFLSAVPYDAQSGFFGATTALSADGQWGLIGAPGGDTAWVAQRQAAPNGWKITQSIKFATTRLTKDFGTALALSATGDRAVISAESTTNISDCKGDYTDCGAVYSFLRQGAVFKLESVFTAKDSHSFNYFGESLALSANGSRAIVGTSNADCINGNCGAAYLFDRTGSAWIQQGRVTSPTAGLGGTDLGGNFGAAVSLSQDGANLLVGANEDNCPSGKQCGKVYHYAITP